MKVEQAKEIAEKALQELITALEQGKSEALKSYLGTMAKFHHYSFGNIMLIGSQMPQASRVAGFNAWKKLNRFVKRGEKGIMILAPLVYNRSPKDGAEDEKTIAGFRAVHVFDVTQTEGEPLPELSEVQGDPAEKLDSLKALISKHAIELEYTDEIAPAEGMSKNGKILILPDLSPAHEFSVLTHELAHELLHQKHRERETTRTMRETEAEAVAFVVTSAIGLNTNTAAADYIQLWKGDKDTLCESLHHIQQAATEILSVIGSD